MCAGKHEPEFPHNLEALYYQMKFAQVHGRYPDWNDALSHCTEEMKKSLIVAIVELVEKHGLNPLGQLSQKALDALSTDKVNGELVKEVLRDR